MDLILDIWVQEHAKGPTFRAVVDREIDFELGSMNIFPLLVRQVQPDIYSS